MQASSRQTRRQASRLHLGLMEHNSNKHIALRDVRDLPVLGLSEILQLDHVPCARESIHVEFPAIVWRICLRIEFEFIDQEHVSRVCICICYKAISCQKARGTCIWFKTDGAQNFSHMRIRIEFAIQVLKQKNAHVQPPTLERSLVKEQTRWKLGRS